MDADECHCFKASSCCTAELPFSFSLLLSLSLCFELRMCHFSLAGSQFTLMESIFSSDANSQSGDSCFLESVPSKEGI